MASVTDLKSELEGGDVSRQMQALVVLMNHLSTDREKVIATGGVPPPVLRLAYDVIRLANLTTGDWEAICRSIKGDLSGQQVHAETAQVVLELVPSVPPPHLVDLVIHQDFGSTLAQFVRHDNPQVRSAAIDAFGACFCLDETLEAMASSPGLVSSTMEWWDTISDAVLDSDADSAAAAVYSVETLLSASASAAETRSSSSGGIGAPSSSDSFHLWRRQSQRVTQRILYGLGAFLHRAGSLPPGAQVHVSRLLSAALRLLAQAVASECYGTALDGLGWAAAPSSRGSSAREGMGLFGASRPDEVRASGALLVWALQEAGRHLYKLLSLTDPAVVAEAAKALLSVASLPIPDPLQAAASPDPSASFAAAADIPAEWTSGSVSALLALWRRQDAGPARHDILLACCRGLPSLEASARSAALPSLLQLSAGLGQSSHRVAVFAYLWHAAVDLDLESQREARTRRSSHSGASATGFPLSALLEHPSVLSIMKVHGSHSSEAASAGGASADPEAARVAPGKSPSKSRLDRQLSGAAHGREQPQAARGAQFPPNVREELASTLLLTISQHSRAAGKILPPPALTDAAASSDGGMADAARSEKVAEALDWVRAAVLVLRSLSPCLAWESATLAVPDAWLRLLQRCAAVSRDLTQHGSSPSRTALLREKSPEPDGAPMPGTGAVGGVQAEFEAVQGLLQQLLSGLPHLGAPLKARALWVLVHHLNLHPKEEEVWRALLAQMANLGLGASQSRTHGARLAAAASQQGILPHVDTLPQPQGSAAAGDLHDLQSTQMQAVLLCVERLAGLLSLAQYAASSAKEEDEQQQEGFLLTTAEDDEKAALVPGLAKGLERVLQGLLHSQQAVLGPDAVDCCQRVQRQLGLLQEEDTSENEVSGYGLFREEDLMVAEGYPFGKPQAAAVGPSASARLGPSLDHLVRAAVADAVQSAQRSTLGTAGCDAKAVLERELVSEGLWALGVHPDGAQNSPVPSAAELTASLGGLVPPRAGSAAAVASASASLASSGQLGDPQQLTGPSDCVHLVAHHSVHPSSSTVSVHFEVCNPLIFDLEGLVLSLGIIGPAHPEGRQPNLVWQLPKVEPQETMKWEARLCISGFGRIQLHPRVTVAKGQQSGKVSDLSIRAAAYEIPLQHLLQPPSVPVSAAAFFQQWESLPARWEASATAHSLGSGQATALLSAIQNCTLLERVWLRGLPVLGGFQAAYQGFTWSGEVVSAVVIVQLLPSGVPSSTEPPSALESGREIVRLVVRSSSHEVIQALEADPGAFVSDLSGGLLSLGLAPPPAVPPLLPPRAAAPTEVMEPHGGHSADAAQSRPTTPDLLSDPGGTDDESQEPGGVAPSHRHLPEATQAERIVQQAAMAEWQRLNCQLASKAGAVFS